MAEWRFATRRFRVELEIFEDHGHEYEGDDDGETQAMLDNGELIAFDSAVRVYFDGQLIGADYLGASIYEPEKISEFWTAHRDPDPMNRNCSLMRAKRGENVSICHYFPGMVHEAIAAARKHLANVPKLRASA